jgi:hypothetical protein
VQKFVDAAISGKFAKANTALRKLWRLKISGDTYKALCIALNPLLSVRKREMTSHGVYRSFRFWGADEKAAYLVSALNVVHDVMKITPNVCFAYGTALAIARHEDLIPHDDDIDILAVVEKAAFPTFDLATKQIMLSLQGPGRTLSQEMPNLIHVKVGRVKVDVFVGLEEHAHLASFPGPRNSIAITDLFPPQKTLLLGAEVPIPSQLEVYLGKLYGLDWRTPNPFFSHNWSQEDYADLF